MNVRKYNQRERYEKMQEMYKDGCGMKDRTTLKIALETDAWMAVYCAEPERLIDVQMRYKDLVAIRKLIVRYCEEQARMGEE